jgi:hypothetical protein
MQKQGVINQHEQATQQGNRRLPPPYVFRKRAGGVVTGKATSDYGKDSGYRGRKGESSVMLRTENLAGTHIYPMYKSGQLDAAHTDKKALTVFVPDGRLEGSDWACTIEGEYGAIILENYEQVAKLITALEIAIERVKAKDGIS